jgi:uncharacterized protein YjhX (UPF0386 family)
MRLSKAEKQILRAAIKGARREVKKSGAAHIQQALTLVDGRLNPDVLDQVYKHLIRAMTEHSRVSQPRLVARAATLTIAAALALGAAHIEPTSEVKGAS